MTDTPTNITPLKGGADPHVHEVAERFSKMDLDAFVAVGILRTGELVLATPLDSAGEALLILHYGIDVLVNGEDETDE